MLRYALAAFMYAESKRRALLCDFSSDRRASAHEIGNHDRDDGSSLDHGAKNGPCAAGFIHIIPKWQARRWAINRGALLVCFSRLRSPIEIIADCARLPLG